MSFNVVIPARFASQRLPGKPLADIAGEAMIVRVARQVLESRATSVVVATDDERIANAVLEAGLDAAMTRRDHACGSDRVMEVVGARGWGDDAIVINVQGDEPLIPPMVIDQLADGLEGRADIGVATLAEPFDPDTDPYDPNAVKVVCSEQQRALYFSRAPIPFPRGQDGTLWRRHVGIYAYRVQALRAFVALPQGRLEAIEHLEQLRLLENDMDILVLDACVAVPGGVDTPEDLERVNALFAAD